MFVQNNNESCVILVAERCFVNGLNIIPIRIVCQLLLPRAALLDAAAAQLKVIKHLPDITNDALFKHL